MTEGQKRLLALNERLKNRGVRSVSFTWAPDAHKQHNEVLAVAVADALDKFLNGDYEVVNLEEVDHDS